MLEVDEPTIKYNACDVMKLCTKFERNRTIRGGVIAISVFDFITLNIAFIVFNKHWTSV